MLMPKKLPLKKSSNIRSISSVSRRVSENGPLILPIGDEGRLIVCADAELDLGCIAFALCDVAFDPCIAF